VLLSFCAALGLGLRVQPRGNLTLATNDFSSLPVRIVHTCLLNQGRYAQPSRKLLVVSLGAVRRLSAAAL
jgi:hypothetical protein